MRFGVLGPLEVWTADGAPVHVPESKVRALLAALLVPAGRPLPVEALIRELWGTNLPENPGAALQRKVWQLRRTLEDAEPGGRELVARRGPGYALLASADAVDAGTFAGLVEQARATEDPRERAALLADALALWRGPAFAGFRDEEFARPAVARLDEQWLTAVEEQAEARLALGEHSPVAAELTDLVRRHPLRERLRAAHMRALYGAGRQGDALAGYDELRRRLADEQGLDPGPELVALQQAILAHDPALAPTAGNRPTNLPAEVTELIGRTEALAETRAMLAAWRLVTLTGPGGVGKTRLALATAAQLTGLFPDGVWLAELAGLEPPGRERRSAQAEVAETVAAVLGLRDQGTAGPGEDRPGALTEWLAGALRDKRLLLVLDNCEHVVEPVAELIGLLLRSAPGLRVLATSQEPLGIAGEQMLSVPPLELPTTGQAPHESAAVQLFVTRAAAAAPGFTLDDGNADAVAAICRRLDGIPLALEMAATRVRALGVAELATRLDDRFHVLGSGARDAPPRQRTLRAVIDWSWALLAEPERTVLRRLAVHSDGCTLAAAEDVCSGDAIARADVVELLARLVDCSLVVMAETADGPRYRLLESVLAYCLERLEDAAEFGRVRLQHLDHHMRLAEQADPQLRGPGQQTWLRRLDAETPNMRAAFDTAVRIGDAERALRLANALTWYWFLRGRRGQARRTLTTALEVPGPAQAAARARATAWRTGITLQSGAFAGTIAEHLAALAPYADVDDPAGRARAEWFLGTSLYGIGDLTPSEDLVDRALTSSRLLGDRWLTAAALSSRAFQAKLHGDFTALRRDGEQSLAVFTELGDQWGRLQAMVPLATLAEIEGNYETATGLYQAGLRIAEELQLWPEVSFQLTGAGRIAILTGDLERAHELHERARKVSIQQSDRFGEQFAVVGLALIARRKGELDTAESHIKHVLELHRQMGYESAFPALLLAELGFIAEQRGDAESAWRLHVQGLTTAQATGDPRAIALALEGMAGAQTLAGHPRRAARLLGAAVAARASAGAPLPPAERGDVNRITARLRAELGPEDFAVEQLRGTELPPDEYLATSPDELQLPT